MQWTRTNKQHKKKNVGINANDIAINTRHGKMQFTLTKQQQIDFPLGIFQFAIELAKLVIFIRGYSALTAVTDDISIFTAI